MADESPDAPDAQDAPDAPGRPDQPQADRPRRQESDWERRRRRAAVFGDVLPETTGDERDPGGEAPREGAGDAWLQAQVPPHHGG